jgi:hypothetical protein
MSMQFAAPASGGEGPSAADVNGHVLVVEPLAYETGIKTVHGDKDAVRLRLHDITDQTTYDDVLWFGGYLVGSLKGRVGERVLAMMGQGAAKAGQSPPWQLTDLSTNEQAVTAATAYLTGTVAATLAAPVATPAAPPVAASALDAALSGLGATVVK